MGQARLDPPAHGEPPVLGATLGGAADGADHWAHTLLNHPDDPHIAAAELGRGPRYFRLQVPLTESVPLDDASHTTLTETLPTIAAELIRTHEAESPRSSSACLPSNRCRTTRPPTRPELSSPAGCCG